MERTFKYDHALVWFASRRWAPVIELNGETETITKCSAPALNVTVSNKNRISSAGFTYDAAGNMTSNGSASYTYDAENRLTATAGVTYTYDGDGRRVKKSNGKLYWYGMSGEVLMETDLAGTTLDEYIFFNGKRIARRRQSDGAVFYFSSDHLGSSRVVTNATGGIVEESDFYPFGGERVITDSLDNNYKFAAEERDAESGLDYFGARYYASTLGRFESPDPVAMATSRLADPQRINLYAYARNNPLVFIDPTGELVQFATIQAEEAFNNYKRFLQQDPEKYKSELATIAQLEASEVTYVVGLAAVAGEGVEGGLTTDGEKIFLNVSNAGGPSGETFSLNSRFAHELEHARQFDAGEFSFVKNSKGDWTPSASYDIFDEVKAWKAQLNASVSRDFWTSKSGQPKPSVLRGFADAGSNDERAGVLQRISGYGNLSDRSINNVFKSDSGRKPDDLVRTSNGLGAYTAWLNNRGMTLR